MLSNTGKKKCISCNREIHVRNFYKSQSNLFEDGLVSVCKECLFKLVDKNDLENSIKSILIKIDKPFLVDVWKATLESDGDPIRMYVKNINSLKQYRDMTYRDSVHENINEVRKSYEENLQFTDDSIQVTDEIKIKWGLGYTDYEYAYLEKFYEDMMSTHEIKTPQHKKNLIQVAKNYLDMDKLQANREWGDLEKLARIQDKLLASSGFRPIDRKGGDEATGLRSFSAVWAEVEKQGFVPPHDPEVTQDILDQTIMYLQNFTLRLLNKEMLTTPPDDTPDVEELKKDKS